MLQDLDTFESLNDVSESKPNLCTTKMFEFLWVIFLVVNNISCDFNTV